MSTPLNPLSNFNSYSYHHILIACSNSDVADAIIANNDIAQFERTSPDGKYGAIRLRNLGGYVVLINGTTDAEFYVDEVEWSSIFSPKGTSISTYKFHAIETDGEMTIIEPNGMRFINVISETAQRLAISAPSMIFLLKTIFVGQHGDGTAETISGIRPMVFTLIDMVADFDYTGATYTLSIVGGRDGYANHPGISHILSGETLTIKKGQTIADALDALMVAANNKYAGRMEKIVIQRKKANANAGIDEGFEPGVDFLPIEYRVKYDNAFTKYPAGDNESASTSDKDGGHSVAFQPEQSIQAGINKIMETSATLVRDTSKGVDHDGRNRKFTYKVSNEVRTQQDKMVVTYNVNLYEITTTQQIPGVEQGKDILPPKDHVIEFDYVFTGKNIDILDFGMRMNMALAYFMTLQSSRSLRSQSEITSSKTTEEVSGNSDQIVAGVTSSFQSTGIPKGPLMILPQVNNETNKKVKALETNTARQVLASFSQMSTIGVKIKIAGNPNILESMLLPPTTGEVDTPIVTEREQSPDDQTTNEFKPDWSHLPAYCKIHIMLPVSSGQPGEYEQFWYGGYYKINSVRNVFSGGEFTQELELFSMPITTAVGDNSSTTGEPISPTEIKVPPAIVPKTPSSTEATSDNVPSVLFSQYDSLIVEKALKYKLDPNLMRALVKTESNFDPNAVSPVGAAGLGQLMPATAKAIAKQQKELGILEKPFVINNTRDDRFDPETNLEFASYLMNQNLTRYRGNTNLALAAYNAGPNAVDSFGPAVPPITFSRGETFNYVKKINGLLALTKIPSPTIPDIPDGLKLDNMTPKQMSVVYKGKQ